MTKIGHDETVTINREIIANHLNVSIFYHILSSRVTTLEQIHRDLLTEHYPKIINQIRVLWKKKFEKLFTPLGIDYDDFEGQALYEISANIHTYNSNKGAAFLTFCSVIINNKMKTYATNLNRDKRIINTVTISLNQVVSEDNGTELIENIPDVVYTEIKAEINEKDKAVEKILKSLPKHKEKILRFLMCGYSAEDIAIQMMFPLSYVKDIINNFSTNPKLISAIQILRR